MVHIIWFVNLFSKLLELLLFIKPNSFLNVIGKKTIHIYIIPSSLYIYKKKKNLIFEVGEENNTSILISAH